MSENIILDYALKNYKKMFREPVGNLKYKFTQIAIASCNS